MSLRLRAARSLSPQSPVILESDIRSVEDGRLRVVGAGAAGGRQGRREVARDGGHIPQPKDAVTASQSHPLSEVHVDVGAEVKRGGKSSPGVRIREFANPVVFQESRGSIGIQVAAEFPVAGERDPAPDIVEQLDTDFGANQLVPSVESKSSGLTKDIAALQLVFIFKPDVTQAEMRLHNIPAKSGAIQLEAVEPGTCSLGGLFAIEEGIGLAEPQATCRVKAGVNCACRTECRVPGIELEQAEVDDFVAVQRVRSGSHRDLGAEVPIVVVDAAKVGADNIPAIAGPVQHVSDEIVLCTRHQAKTAAVATAAHLDQLAIAKAIPSPHAAVAAADTTAASAAAVVDFTQIVLTNQ